MANNFTQVAKQFGYKDEEIQAILNSPRQAGAQAPQQQAANDPRGSVVDTLVDWLPTIGSTLGSIGGGIAGTFVAPGAGTVGGGVVGAGAGGALGEWAQQLIRGEDVDAGEIAKEGALGAGGQLVGGALGKVGIKYLAPTLSKVADDFAIKGLRLRPTQLNNFITKHGEDVSETLSRHGLQGASVDDIAIKGIKPLQQAYDDIAKNADAIIQRSQLDDTVLRKIDPLLKSAVEEDHLLAEKILSSYDFATRQLGDGPLSMAQANAVRKSFDSQVKNWTTDVLSAGKNRVLGNVFRESMQEAADAAGSRGPAGQTFKQIGRELSKLYDIEDAAKLQSQLGRGSLPVGLTTLLGWGAGGPIGGAAGGALSAAATNILNRTGTSRILSRMAGRGSQVAQNFLQGPTSQTLVGQGLVRGAAGGLGGSAAMPQTTNAQPATTELPGLDPSALNLGSTQQSGLPDIPQPGGISQDQLRQLIAIDLAETGGQNVSQIEAIAKMVGSGSEKQKLSTGQLKEVSDIQNSIQLVSGLIPTLQQHADRFGPVRGNIGSRNPYDLRRIAQVR